MSDHGGSANFGCFFRTVIYDNITILYSFIGGVARYRIQDDHDGNYGTGAEAGLLKSVQVPGGNLVTFIYTPSGGSVSLLNAVQDWAGRRWTFQYDTGRYLTTYTTPLGCSTRYGYTTAGATVTVVNAVTDPRGFVTTYAYDSQRRVVSLAAADGVWTFSYDTISQTHKVSPSGAITTYNINNISGMITGIVRPQGYTETFGYDNAIKITDSIPAGNILDITLDHTLWLPLTSKDPLGNATTYAYDSFGNLTTLTDANGKVSTFAYAGTGSTRQRIRATDPLGRVTAYTYTSDGQLKAVTDSRSLVTSYISR